MTGCGLPAPSLPFGAPMTRLRTALVTVTLLAGVALSGCSGDSGGDDDTAAGCSPGSGTALRALTDDKAALPADNWVPVLATTRDDYRDTLGLLDQASLGFSTEDLQALVAAGSGDPAKAAVEQAVSDVAEADPGTAVIRLQVPEGATAQAVGSYYKAALDRLGARAIVERAELGAALDDLPGDDRAATPVVITGLTQLAAAVGADLPDGGDPSAQVQAVATAALTSDLALGSTAAATSAAQVLVPDALISGKSLVTLSDLAKACSDAVVAVVGDDPAAADAVAAAYGFEVGDEVDDPASAFTKGSDALAVVTSGA